MKLYQQIFIAFLAIIISSSWYFIDLLSEQIETGSQQTTEEVLVDISNLLAEVVQQDVITGDFRSNQLAGNIERFLKRRINADIYSVNKSGSALRVYITDQQGIVRYHSDPNQFAHLIGQDYSQWNDVYLTLQGKYGARSTKEPRKNTTDSVMYVAAPILDQGKIIGVISVGKPGHTVQPFIDRAISTVKRQALLFLVITLAFGALLSFWLTRSLRQLTDYASKIASGTSAKLPQLKDRELNQLAQAIDHMREELQGKKYVEQYIHSLTHEFKSPLAAISGASELLDQQMPKQDFQHFLSNICHQTDRMNQLVSRLLQLASIERLQQINQTSRQSCSALIAQLAADKQSSLQQKSIKLETQIDSGEVFGDLLLIQQALDNLVQNAIDFSPENSAIHIQARQQNQQWIFEITDQGTGIPDYAKEQIFDRFYSLARPDGGQKSTGLGLALVAQVARLHQGSIEISGNVESGTCARLIISNNY